MIVVVLGMHASGTSMVSHSLIQMGIHMGSLLMKPMKGMPVYENARFVRLNSTILKMAGSDWGNPPTVEKICRLYQDDGLKKRIVELIQSESKHQRWGWKDPRQAITNRLYHPYLEEPRYIYVYRNPKEVARSILARGPSAKNLNQWIEVAELYNEHIRRFLADFEPSYIQLRFDRLINKSTAPAELSKIVELLELPNRQESIAKGISIIQFRK